ncbi:MAG: hypothetical protein J7K40_15060 [candidate division Zixibacteria bacterium]|nr:hypothetical protein [candidate division Zixibacteria bacterium]
MKKAMLFSTAICFVLFAFSASFAEPLKISDKVKIGGQLLTKAFSLKNYKGSEVTDNFALTRALINTDFIINSEVAISLKLGHTRVWGKSVDWYQGGGEPGAAEYLTGDGSFLENISIHNANFKVSNIWKDVDFTVGRQFVGEKEDAFFYYGPQSGRLLAVTSIDAIKADWDIGKVKMMSLYGKKSEAGLGDGSGQDSTFMTTGLYVNDKDTDIYAMELRNSNWLESQNLKAFFYSRRRGLDSGEKDHLELFGMRARGPITPVAGLEYDVMFGLDFGKNNETNQTYGGSLWRAIAFYNNSVSNLFGFKLTGGYVEVSGDNASTTDKDENFRRIGRDCFYSMAVIVYEILNDAHPEAVTNVVIPFAGFEATPEALDGKLTLKTMWSDLSCDTPILGYTEKGQEIDVNLMYNHSDSFHLGLTAARFYPGDLLKFAFGSDNPITQVSMEFKVTF